MHMHSQPCVLSWSVPAAPYALLFLPGVGCPHAHRREQVQHALPVLMSVVCVVVDGVQQPSAEVVVC